MQGTIHRLIRSKGFGFIQTEARQYFFHHTEVRGLEFRQLSVGDVVEFQEIEEEPGKNPRAVELSVVVKAPPALPSPPKPPRPPREPVARTSQDGQRAHGPSRLRGPGRMQGAGAHGPKGPVRRAPRPPAHAPVEDAFGSYAPVVASRPPVEDADEFQDELPGQTPSNSSEVDGAGELEPVRSDAASPRRSAAAERPVRRPHAAPRTPGRGVGSAQKGGRRPVGRGRPRGPGSGSGDRGPARSPRPKASGTPGERGEGVIRSINLERGFGFIETPAGDLFFHRTGVKDEFEMLNVGARVAFTFGAGERGTKAEDISAV
ncbi:MAG TPA: cold shock domain-containing protein [Planctomycetota bacterium]|nr:cold shock domain-containing protein [Planctomycetota bacterium]